MAVHEVLQVNAELRDLISSRAAEGAIRRAAQRNGMRTLIEDGIEKAAQGLTTLDELLRVVAYDGAAVVEAADATGEPADTESQEILQPVAGRRILIVDDSATILSVVKYFLELEGFEVLVAQDGAAALELAIRDRPDAIVSDVNMPGIGGVELVKALRKDARTAGIRVLMLTSESSVERETEGLEAGADDYILKPVEPRRLVARLKTLLGRSRL